MSRTIGPVRPGPVTGRGREGLGGPGPQGSGQAGSGRVQLQVLLALTALLAGGGLVLGASHLGVHGATDAVGILGMLAGVALVYLVCTAEPVYIFTLAIVLTPFASNWQQLHIPGPAAPDRLLFVIGALSVLCRSYLVGTLPRPRFAASHAVMALTLAYAAMSAVVWHNLFQKGPGLLLIETFGVLPFISFWLGPVIFPTERERMILLRALVVMGAYLGLTALLETTGPKALVWPRYIENPAVGLHFGRARGPFADAVANGVGLYVGAVSSAIAAYKWRAVRWRQVLAGAICLLCLAGTIMTLERSIWISTVVATIVGMLASRWTRRYAVPVIVGLAALCAVAIFAIPGLEKNVSQRLSSPESLYDRENATQTAIAMVEAKPLLGFGWNQFAARHDPYIRESPNIPLTGQDIVVHNVYLTYAVELGLVGATLWLLAVILGAGGTAITRAPPEIEPWRIGLVALLVFFLIGESAVPPTVFVNASLWLWAAVVAVVRYPATAPEFVLRRREAASATPGPA
jgi:putative inorganic carbon (HCO3(-)) transporter